HDPPRELVDDLHLALLDDVVDVTLVEGLRLERLDQVIDELDVVRAVEVVDPERALDLLDPGLGRRHSLVLLVVQIVVLVREALVLDLDPLRLTAVSALPPTPQLAVPLPPPRP